MRSFSAELLQNRAQNTNDKDIFENDKTLLTLDDTLSQQRIMNHIKECDTPVADKAAFEVEFQQYRTDMNTKHDRLQASLEDQTKRANKEQKEHKHLFLSDKSRKALLQHRNVYSKNVEDLQYQVDVAVAKKC